MNSRNKRIVLGNIIRQEMIPTLIQSGLSEVKISISNRVGEALSVVTSNPLTSNTMFVRKGVVDYYKELIASISYENVMPKHFKWDLTVEIVIKHQAEASFNLKSELGGDITGECILVF